MIVMTGKAAEIAEGLDKEVEELHKEYNHIPDPLTEQEQLILYAIQKGYENDKSFRLVMEYTLRSFAHEARKGRPGVMHFLVDFAKFILPYLK